MSAGMKIEGVSAVVAALLQKLKERGDLDPSVSVGYQTNYALFVHENLEAHHPVGQAKYLEGPARAMTEEVGKLVNDVVAGGGTLEQGLLVGGLAIQRASQLMVPVDKGILKNSAFTKVDDDR